VAQVFYRQISIKVIDSDRSAGSGVASDGRQPALIDIIRFFEEEFIPAFTVN